MRCPPRSHYALLDALLRMKSKYRTVLYLFYYEDCAAEEIARLLRIPRATVLTQLRRGRELLKKELEEA